MADKSGGSILIEAGQEWDVIPLYEQILDAHPDDVAALEVLVRAYHTVGEISKSCQYGLRLADVVLRGNDLSRMAGLCELLRPHADTNDAIGAVVQRLNAQLGTVGGGAPAPAARPPAPVAASRLRAIGSQAAKSPAPAVPPPVSAPAAPPVAAGAEPQPEHPAAEPERDLAGKPAAGSSAAIDEAMDRVAAFLGGGGAAARPPPAPSTARAAAAKVRKANPLSDAGRRRTIISEEMNLAWDLQQAGLLTEEQYAAVVRDLTEISSSEVPVTISALHAIQFRNYPNIAQVLQHVASKSETPIIPLASFDPQGAAFGALPIEYMIVQGVLPFECLGTDLLVALLNPLNERVRCEVPELAGQQCHFFLASPSEFDTTLETVKNRYPGVAALRRQTEA